MMEDIIRKLKIERQEMDPDVISDYNFIMGDLNYRFNSTFDDMVEQNQIEMASSLLPEKDQLTQSMNKKGNQIEVQQPDGSYITRYFTPKYPNYQEHRINFKPTYKRNMEDNEYKNKKNQAPSYCDRILFKNNTSNEINFNYYTCLDQIYGSDHRPVVLSLRIKQR